jgi:prepilin-type N-terminal cleavage/methylation domain-containing protein
MKGFSLIEILIFMVIIAVLLLLGISGIRILQRNSRDNQRMAIAGEMNNLINKFRREKLRYPDSEVSFQTNQFSISGMTESIPLTGFLVYVTTSTTNGATRYIYDYQSSSNYQLCVQLETLQWEQFGTAGCP